ncbi:quinone oxidoreductase family protein [Pararhodonellum marinum]|uniref:quinone oxidoreductase family protein n=1 Tax=Pararhodonellum marinum TaxID=2755358 RepID=UPI001E59A282|nr:zinc-binding dehydrogenase [Pararhodonellum marinum]
MTKSMKQVVFQEFGKPEVLNTVEVAIPQAGPGEVIVKIHASGINFSDSLRRRNAYFQPTPLPYVLGSEAAGEIVAVGEGVKAPFQLGTMVLAILPYGGGYSEYVTALAQYCIPLPESIDPKSATAIFVQGSTAQLMVSQLAGKMEGKTALVNAAAGGVGSLLVQLLKLQGAKVIAACSTTEKLAFATKLGADAGVNYTTPNWSQSLLDFNSEKQVDVVFEMVGGEVYNESLKCLKPGGKLIVYGCASGIQGHIHPEYFVDHSLSQFGFNLAYQIGNHMGIWQEQMGKVIQLMAEGKLEIATSHSFSLDQAAEAHRQLENRNTTGKVILIP